MFDRFVAVVPHGHQTHNHHVTVNVPEATPEKAATLLDGLRKDAERHVRNALLVDVPDIGVKVVTYELWRNPMDLSVEHRLAFTINGRAYDIAMKHHEKMGSDADMLTEVAAAIGRAILGRAVSSRKHIVEWRSLLR